MPELRRENAQMVAGTPSLIATLALKADAVLGYSWLRRRLGLGPRSLACVLNELGIEPFRVEDVENYKIERARAAEREVLAEYAKRAKRDGFIFSAGSYARAKWRVVPLRNYEGEVPEFALSHALELKERVPEAEFEVEELRVEKRYDPFLVVRCGRERFYIDVWDERDFEKEHS